jgi:uncharacterized protein (TIGR03437 family)
MSPPSIPHIQRVIPDANFVGAAVEIHGTGFAPRANDNVVTFAGVAAVLLSASAERIVAQVPLGATTGLIFVTAHGHTAHSPGTFVVYGTTEPGS